MCSYSLNSSSVDRFIGIFHKVTFEVLRVLTVNIAFFGDVMLVDCSCYKWQEAQF